jgi:transcriptional regulator with XRE-family HTH domain
LQYQLAKVINIFIMSIIGNKIKLLREILNLNQLVFSEMIGLKRSNLSQIEIGNSHPRYETIELIVNTFHIPADFLFNENIGLETENGKLITTQNIPTDIKVLQNSIERLDDQVEYLNERLSICQERLKNKEEWIEILETKLEGYGYKRKAHH